MRYSSLGIIFICIFLFVTLGFSLMLEISFGDGQWAWGIIFGGYPWTGFAFMESSRFLGGIYFYGGYILNLSIMYGLGFGIEFLYKKFSR